MKEVIDAVNSVWKIDCIGKQTFKNYLDARSQAVKILIDNYSLNIQQVRNAMNYTSDSSVSAAYNRYHKRKSIEFESNFKKISNILNIKYEESAIVSYEKADDINLNKIIELVKKVTGVKCINSETRIDHVVKARYIYYKIAEMRTRSNQDKISSKVNKNRASVYSGVKTFNSLVKQDKDLENNFKTVLKRFDYDKEVYQNIPTTYDSLKHDFIELRINNASQKESLHNALIELQSLKSKIIPNDKSEIITRLLVGLDEDDIDVLTTTVESKVRLIKDSKRNQFYINKRKHEANIN